MAGWSLRTDGSSVDCAKTPEKLEPAGPWVDLEPLAEESYLDSEPDKFRFSFNKILGSFLKEICAKGCFSPLPPMLGDGQSVDLCKLFLVVREKGGYNAVSESGSWDLVAKESGLGLGVASAVKLVYVKYLVSLERWLESIVHGEDSKNKSSYSGHLMELGAELRGFLLEPKKKVMELSQVEETVVAGSDEGEKCVKDEESMHIDLTKRFSDYEDVGELQNEDELKSLVVDSAGDKKCMDVDEYEDIPSDLVKSVVNSSDVEKMSYEDDVKSEILGDCVECKISTNIDDDDDDDDVVILNFNDVKDNFSSLKRKRDSTWGMLNWVTEIAKDPCDPVIGSLPDRSKWKSYGSEELWKQVLLFREVAFQRKDDPSSADQSNWQKYQKMHPCMYDDQTKFGYNLRERLSCTKFGKVTSKGQDFSPPSSSGNHGDLDCSMAGIDKQSHRASDSATPGSVFDYDADIEVPIGPYFQVEVPEWTGVASESDSKWLGTRVWPLEKNENRFLIERDRIGMGRQDSCGCQVQGSTECVKFHVAEKRQKVKLELGSAFNRWKFDKMGDGVALAWKEEERKRFSSIVKSNPPSLDKCFWDEIYKHFRNKSREELVCYYYNVFLLQRRAYQNRFTPSNINSDDEEAETESVTNGIKHVAVKSRTSILISPKKSQKRSRYSSSSKYGTL